MDHVDQAYQERIKLAVAVLQLADQAGMPDSYWQVDSRIFLAREVLQVPSDGRESHSHLWEE